jgi:hypothetical protein
MVFSRMTSAPRGGLGTLLPGGVLFAGAVLIAVLPPATASAQIANFQGAPTGPVVGGGDDAKQGPKTAPPPALPGSRVQKLEPAPAAPGAADLPPTEALFDAINRGDILSARDAINRGAELGGKNVLGLTPLDLSIDLGRNDITFLLLSLRPSNPRDSGPPTTVAGAASRRGGKGAPAAAVAAAPAPAAPAPPPMTRAQRLAAEREARAHSVSVAAQSPASPNAAPAPDAPAPQAMAPQPAAASQPRQYAGQRGESGTPIPQMGFLGFGTVTR